MGISLRNVVALLLAVAAGYFLYIHQELWRKSSAEESQEPCAVQMLTRGVNGGALNAQVAVVDGSRWRLEVNDPRLRKILVVLCDGSEVFSNAGPKFPGATLDPRAELNWVLSTAAKYRASASMSQNLTEGCDGVVCWKLDVIYEGVGVKLWINVRTGFPVCLIGAKNGKYSEVHFMRIPINFQDPGTSAFFDAGHVNPIFTSYLPR